MAPDFAIVEWDCGYVPLIGLDLSIVAVDQAPWILYEGRSPWGTIVTAQVGLALGKIQCSLAKSQSEIATHHYFISLMSSHHRNLLRSEVNISAFHKVGIEPTLSEEVLYAFITCKMPFTAPSWDILGRTKTAST